MIRTQRVKGRGKGSDMGFPTINITLPLGTIELGLWAVVTKYGKSMALLSNYKGEIRGEIHVHLGKVEVGVGEYIDLLFLKKLRDPIKIKNVQKTIQDDKDLSFSFWQNCITCENCERHYQQDYGYSNYTVEGTSYGCYANIWEEIDDYYTFNILKYHANTCKFHKAGDFWQLDVDGENSPPTESWFIEINRDIKLTDLLGD